MWGGHKNLEESFLTDKVCLTRTAVCVFCLDIVEIFKVTFGHNMPY